MELLKHIYYPLNNRISLIGRGVSKIVCFVLLFAFIFIQNTLLVFKERRRRPFSLKQLLKIKYLIKMD